MVSVQRFNVAITRARSLLIIVGNPHLLENDTNWNVLVNFTQTHGSYRGCKYSPRRGVEWMEQVLDNIEKLKLDAD
jgi:helicase MOV-10